MIKMVDVDYYVNMPAMLRHGLPIVLSTFCPTTAGDSLPDAVFSIDKDDYVNFRVQGGAEYRHQLWDYESDFLWLISGGVRSFTAQSQYLTRTTINVV